MYISLHMTQNFKDTLYMPVSVHMDTDNHSPSKGYIINIRNIS